LTRHAKAAHMTSHRATASSLVSLLSRGTNWFLGWAPRRSKAVEREEDESRPLFCCEHFADFFYSPRYSAFFIYLFIFRLCSFRCTASWRFPSRPDLHPVQCAGVPGKSRFLQRAPIASPFCLLPCRPRPPRERKFQLPSMLCFPFDGS
jgi:hypothetical protein